MIAAAAALGFMIYNTNSDIAARGILYKKKQEEEGEQGHYPIEFPVNGYPKQIWGNIGDWVHEPSMNDRNGQYQEGGTFHDLGIYGTPKKNYMHSGILYPVYRSEAIDY